MMPSVFEYRAPTEEEKVKLANLQKWFIAIEEDINAATQDSTLWLEMARDMVGLRNAIRELVPSSHERDNAELRMTQCYNMLRYPENIPHSTLHQAIDALRECRMWANAAIVLVR